MNTQNTDFSPAPADEMLNDIQYSKAQQLAKLMLSQGLLSPSEFQALTDINREAFNPLYREILPNTGCYKQPSEFSMNSWKVLKHRDLITMSTSEHIRTGSW